MSLNTLLAGSNPPTMAAGERLLTHGHATDAELRIPATIEGPKRTMSSSGRIWVSNHRVIYLADDPTSGIGTSSSSPLTTLEIPYSILLSTKFNLPLLSPNNITLSFLPDPLAPPPATLPNPGRGSALEVKLVVGEGAAHAVWKVIEGERAGAEERRRRGEEEDLPAYQP